MAWQRIRAWPTNQSLYELLFHRLHYQSEEYLRNGDRAIISEERVFQTKPWLLPGLREAPDGKSLAWFFAVKPEWNVVDGVPLQRTCQDGCWQELAGQVAFFKCCDFNSRVFVRTLRRMFSLRGLGAQEGPAGKQV
eukprot:jgi/Mesen1/659/ME000109S10877